MGNNKPIKVESLKETKKVDYDGNLAFNVKWARNHMVTPKISQAKLAEKAGVSEDTIKHIETGMGAKFSVVCRIAEFFGISVGWFTIDHSAERKEDIEITLKQKKMIPNMTTEVEFFTAGIEELKELMTFTRSLVEEQKETIKLLKEYKDSK